MKTESSHPLYTRLMEISNAAKRAADLTRQFLAFARKQTVAPKVLNLNETLTGMLSMLHRLIGEHIHLNWQPASNLWPIKIDPSHIDQILANLCVNARDSIADIGKISIKTGNCVIDEQFCTDIKGFDPGEYVQLTFSDSGCGMDEETIVHIFEPFFTTKDAGKGTGLGLATVYGIVKQNKGFINVDSKPNQGTVFTIYLPRYVGDINQTRTESLVAPLERGEETILLVEDESTILNTAMMMLEEQGYTVLAATSPDVAIGLAKEHPSKIHLLITDVIMPGMNGRELAKNVQDLFPDIKLLFMSGYTANVIAPHGVLDEGFHFIQKPFTLPDLAGKVREVLEC